MPHTRFKKKVSQLQWRQWREQIDGLRNQGKPRLDSMLHREGLKLGRQQRLIYRGQIKVAIDILNRIKPLIDAIFNQRVARNRAHHIHSCNV